MNINEWGHRQFGAVIFLSVAAGALIGLLILLAAGGWS